MRRLSHARVREEIIRGPDRAGIKLVPALLSAEPDREVRSIVEREKDTASFERATTALSDALLALSLGDQGDEWSTTQTDLGIAYMELGEKTGDARQFELARKRFMQALKIHTPRSDPDEWAATMQNLGSALEHQGAQSNDSRLLAAAVDTYHEMLRSTSRDKDPILWAATQRGTWVSPCRRSVCTSLAAVT